MRTKFFNFTNRRKIHWQKN